ncbi:response regulator transcription factor [Streptomyces sp. NPDC091972]|uniref:response regulator transcription factor n=1 Tax=Streptomyces sp. NPDC091972 TaxID=3366007 RepID=UPI00380BA913
MDITSPSRRPALLRPDGGPVRVLVVDHASPTLELLSVVFQNEGWVVRGARDGHDAITVARHFRPDAVLLEVVPPGMSCADFLTCVRREHPALPALLLGATSQYGAEEGFASLTAGGVDYMTTPFSLEDVVTRMRALIRRSGKTGRRNNSILVVGDLVLDEASRHVTRSGDSIHLTATEFELLRLLMQHPQRALSKSRIMDRVWEYDFGGKTNVVEVCIYCLRRKIDSGREPMIHTRRGVGYLIKPASDTATRKTLRP